MTKFFVSGVLEIDEDLMYDRNNPDEVEWFRSVVFGDNIYIAEDGHGELGDVIGDFKIDIFHRALE